jgi:hypothetical protein
VDIDPVIDDVAEYGENNVVVRVPYLKYQNVLIPAKESSDVCMMVFRRMTVSDGLELERHAFLFRKNNENIDISGIDHTLYRYLLLRRTLLRIDNEELPRRNGWVLGERWKGIKNMNGAILGYALSQYESLIFASNDEDMLLDRQAAILTGDSGRVVNPCHGISLYCTLTSMWEKMGISADKTDQMRNDDYMKIRKVLMKESEALKRKSKK